ncbi:hypothetical protein BU17DRAFT_81778 [Hysterangium stoloniferum]|nr:hypothetical protein BU17DRAFT_81778 [Hysterangium stoloniferum]
MASATSSAAPDVSSLRAAALLTLKSKRRPRRAPLAQVRRTSPDRPDDGSSVTATRRGPPSPELNYGSDEGLADAEGSTEEDEPLGGEKEEGEISDDEIAPPKDTVPMDIDTEPLPGLISPSAMQPKDGGNNESVPVLQPLNIPSQASSLLLNVDPTTPVSSPRTGTVINSHSQAPSLAKSTGHPPMSAPLSGKLSKSHPTDRPLTDKPSSPPLHMPMAPSKPLDASVPAFIPASISDEIPRFTSSHSQSSDIDRRHQSEKTFMGKSSNSRFLQARQSVVSLSHDERHRPSLVVSPSHARPALDMTADEFLEAKSIILDLLGWGVPADYFMDCGLTREALFYAFSELNLKLPVNFNAEGIIPYGPPPEYVTASVLTKPTLQDPSRQQVQASQGNKLVEQPSKSSVVPDAYTSSSRRVSAGNSSGSIKLGVHVVSPAHPLPPRPKSTTPHSSPTDLPTTAHTNGHLFSSRNGFISNEGSLNPGLSGEQAGSQLSFPPSKSTGPVYINDTPTHGYSGNLDEIETLRRKELLARKAVLASLRPKTNSFTGQNKASLATSVSGSRPPTVRSPRPLPVPLATVDDFLKSITSETGPSDDSSKHVQTKSLELMDVDSKVSIQDSFLQDSRGATSSSMQYAFPFSASSSGDSQSMSNQQTMLPPRKHSTRRPVASDFVDDAVRDNPYANSFGYNTSGSLNSNGLNRGLSSTPSFSNLTSSRKLIIDFSDSEGDDCMEGIVDDGTEDSARPSSRAASHQPLLSQTGGHLSSSGTPEPIHPPVPPLATMNATPEEVLLQKEEEIKKMKQKIAEREKNRLKKLASQSKSLTPPPLIVSPPPEAPVKDIEEEESDLVDMPDIQSTMGDLKQDTTVQSEEAFTVPANGIILEEEDTVKNDILPADASIRDISHTPTPISTGTPTSETNEAGFGDQGNIDCRSWARTSGKRRSGFTALKRFCLVDEELDLSVNTSEVARFSLTESSERVDASLQATNITGQTKLYFSTYQSPLSPFASFRSASVSDAFKTVDTSSSSSLTFPLLSLSVDRSVLQQLPALLGPLKQGAILKLDPKRTICQFEIPGAGNCRDSSCPSVHLRAFEPTDEETARYLAKALPAPQPSAQDIKAALGRVRASKQDQDFDTRVSETLLQLGVR